MSHKMYILPVETACALNKYDPVDELELSVMMRYYMNSRDKSIQEIINAYPSIIKGIKSRDGFDEYVYAAFCLDDFAKIGVYAADLSFEEIYNHVLSKSIMV